MPIQKLGWENLEKREVVLTCSILKHDLDSVSNLL